MGLSTDRRAAYQGQGWQPRKGTHAGDVAEGAVWARCGVDSEWLPLRQVLLHLPSTRIRSSGDPDVVQHLDAVDYHRLRRQISAYAEVLERFGIRVSWAPIAGPRSLPPPPPHNRFFVRDQFLMTPAGAILGRMASRVRRGEEAAVALGLARLGIPLLRAVGGGATFEGADGIWLGPRTVLVGVGNRTSQEGFVQVRAVLHEQGIEAIAISMPRGVQHLLGILQLVDERLAVVRGERAPQQLRDVLADRGIAVVMLPETREIERQSMNLVTIAPRRVLMVSDTPRTEQQLEAAGVRVCARVNVSEAIKAAGGLACMTGILERELTRSTGDSRHAASVAP